eukprot:813548-Rhodomonas_salina.1
MANARNSSIQSEHSARAGSHTALAPGWRSASAAAWCWRIAARTNAPPVQYPPSSPRDAPEPWGPRPETTPGVREKSGQAIPKRAIFFGAAWKTSALH